MKMSSLFPRLRSRPSEKWRWIGLSARLKRPQVPGRAIDGSGFGPEVPPVLQRHLAIGRDMHRRASIDRGGRSQRPELIGRQVREARVVARGLNGEC
jgi:hypothetical protein